MIQYVYVTLKLWHSCANGNYQTLMITLVLPKKKNVCLKLFDEDSLDCQQIISTSEYYFGG